MFVNSQTFLTLKIVFPEDDELEILTVYFTIYLSFYFQIDPSIYVDSCKSKFVICSKAVQPDQ